MNIARGKLAAGVIAGLMMLSTADVARSQDASRSQPAGSGGAQEQHDQNGVTDGPMAAAVRQATSALQDAEGAAAAGYVLSGGCVTGPEEGAMGVHYVNTALVEDGALDVAKPEALVYEPQQGGRLRLVAVEYIVVAEQWNASNQHPPVLNGQHFHYVPAPNRAGLPAYYELHVWAWKRNPHGTFTDWNPRVNCDAYSPATTTTQSPSQPQPPL
jgi:hypothetical protein